MKASEFRNLIREEIKKVLNENAEFKVGQVVMNDAEENLKIVKVYPNLKAAMSGLKKDPDYKQIAKRLKDLTGDTSYSLFSKDNDESTWYLVTLKGKPNLGRHLFPESMLSKD